MDRGTEAVDPKFPMSRSLCNAVVPAVPKPLGRSLADFVFPAPCLPSLALGDFHDFVSYSAQLDFPNSHMHILS